MKIVDFIADNNKFNIKKHGEEQEGFVYFICEDDGEIIYIGSTISLHLRIVAHSLRIEFYNKPVFFFLNQKAECAALERKLIRQIKPKYNIKCNPENKTKCNVTVRKDIAVKIRNKLIEVMKKNNISQTKLAKILGVSRQRVFSIINEPTALYGETINKIEMALLVLSSPEPHNLKVLKPRQTIKIDTDKIKNELKRRNKTQYWLSEEIGASKQLVSYWLRTKSIAGAERIAKALDMEPKDLIR